MIRKERQKVGKSDRDRQMIGEKIDLSSWFNRYKRVKFNAKTGHARCFYSKLLKTVASKDDEFRAGNVRNW